MKASTLIKKYIIEEYQKNNNVVHSTDYTDESIDKLFWSLMEGDELSEEYYNFREEFSDETGLECNWSRHYESKSVARKIDDKWVGWTYWYGGGKHGEPEGIDWIENAYYLEATPKLVEVLTFKKMES